MPDILKVPSIWDYIAGAGTQGIQTFQDARQRLHDEQMQQAGLYTNLFNQGSIDSTDLMPALKKVGIDLKINPSEKELQRDYSRNPDINPISGKPWTEAEKARAGIQTKAGELAMQNELITEQTKNDFVNGKPLTERQAKFAGVPTDDELALGKLQTQDKVLSEAGPKFVDMALANYGGKVPNDWNKVVDQAFGAYTAYRKRLGMPVDPAQRAFFVSQIFDRKVEQRKLDIEALHAQAAMTQATRPLTSAVDRQFQALTGVVDTRRKALDDYVSANPIVALKLNDPKFANDPAVLQYKQLQRSVVAAQNAQAQAASLTPEQAKLLRIDETPINSAPIRPGVVYAGMQIAKQNKQTAAQIRAQVTTGRLTAAEAEEIIRRVGAK